MNAVKIVVFCLSLLASFAFAQGNESEELRKCRDAFRLVGIDPESIGARSRDLVPSIDKIEVAARRLRELARSTKDRNQIVIAELWIQKAREVIAAREAQGKENMPNPSGGFFLGLSRLGEASLDAPKPFRPLRSTINPQVSRSKLPRYELFTVAEYRDLVQALQNGGPSGLDRKFGEFTEARGFAKIEMLTAKLFAFEEGSPGNIDITLGILAKSTSMITFLGEENYFDPYFKELREPTAFIDFFKTYRKFRLEASALRKAILDDPSLRNPTVQANSIDNFLLDPIASITPLEAFEPESLPLPAELKTVYQEFRAQSEFETEFIEENGRNPNQSEVITELMNDPIYRKRFAAAAANHLKARSDTLKRRLEDGIAKIPLRVDILIVGAGLHEQNMQNYLAQNSTGMTTLTVERNQISGSTFGNGGLGFNLNSSSKGVNRSNLRQQLGDGDLNFLPGGQVQVNEFSTQKNPPAVYWGQTIPINRSFAPGDILFGEEAIAVRPFLGPDGDTYPFEVELRSGIKVLARAVVETGIGVDKFPPIPGLKDAYERNKSIDLSDPSRILTYQDLMGFITRAKKPLSPFSKKRVAVLGAGDSGKASVRWFIGEANPEAYGRDTTQTAYPDKVLWYGQTCDTCEAFVVRERAFYADLSSGFRSGRVQPKDKAIGVEQLQDGKFRITTTENENGNTRTQSEIVDYIVVTTGFINEINIRYEGFVGNEAARLSPTDFIENSANVRIVQGYEPSLGVVGIGRQLVQQSGFPVDAYFVGPLAGRITSDTELKAIGENSVANANHNWRVWRFIEALSLRLNAGVPPSQNPLNLVPSSRDY